MSYTKSYVNWSIFFFFFKRKWDIVFWSTMIKGDNYIQTIKILKSILKCLQTCTKKNYWSTFGMTSLFQDRWRPLFLSLFKIRLNSGYALIFAYKLAFIFNMTSIIIIVMVFILSEIVRILILCTHSILAKTCQYSRSLAWIFSLLFCRS